MVEGEVVVEVEGVEKSRMNLQVKMRRNHLTRLRFNAKILKDMGILNLNVQMRKIRKKKKRI